MYDDSRFAYDYEFNNSLQKQKIDEKREKSGIVLKYENGYVYTDSSDNHTLIFGNTGSKKTRNFCIPSVYTIAQADESMVISDPKGEIYQNTSGFLNSCGYNIIVINIRNPKIGNFWNPLKVAYNYYINGNQSKAIEMITDLSVQLKNQIHSEKDPYWEMVACDLFIGITLMLFESADSVETVNFASIQKIREYIKVYDSSEDKSKIFWDFADTFEDNDMIMSRLESTISLKKVEKTLSCVLSSFDLLFHNIFISQDIIQLTSLSDFEYDELYQKKTAIFMIMPDEKKTFHFIVSMFIKQCYEYLIHKAQNMNGMLPIRVNYILDEFSNLSKISDMPSMISAGRSRNIRFILIVQSSQQLKSTYSDEASTIKSNCQNWIFLASREVELLREVSELCGDVYIENRGYRPLLGITALQTLKIGWENSQALILKNHYNPYISWVKDFSKYPQSDIEPIEISQHKKVTFNVFSVMEFMAKHLESDIDDDYEFDIDDLFS